ncbi:DoxX family protein [Actinopolymorpha singaporensis]|uniref:DoxX-like family protein n=1 Tax=Actinopolymorpha singaporensis TaxID=117157 RepID=A0A1H1YC35_9ACTN|nr:DoxX family protein [Actinopolymorpha singaporensis]SDT18962.1 DoxX-like family protein [Actinopolymorpha singaporensis]
MTRTMTAFRPADQTSRTRARWRPGVYWTATALVVGECAIGGAMDLLRMPPFYPVMIELGYPSYLATIMGTAKIAAAVVLSAPHLPRLKEWAYAGVMINLLGAIASTIAVHQPTGSLIAPFAFAGLTLSSWALRPPSRRL